MISIVVPTYNRGDLLNQTIETIVHYISEKVVHQTPHGENLFELILILDGGTEATKEAVLKLCKQYSYVKALWLKEQVGQQNATLAGINYCQYDKIVTLDDDLEHDLASLPKMLQKLDEGYDLVYGVGRRKKRKFYRHLGTYLKECLFQWTIKKPKDITLTSYKAMNKNVANYLRLDTNKYVYLSARALQGDFKIGQVIGESHVSIDSKSGYKLTTLIRSVYRGVIYYCQVPFYKQLRKKGKAYEMERWIK